MSSDPLQSTGIYRAIHLVAHRGNARDYPENTLPALASAADLGLRFVEFDVQLSADRIPVVIHDHELSRTTGLQGSVFERSANLLTAMDAHEPGRFGDRFKNVRIPLLSDAVRFIEERRNVTAFVEIKRASLRHFGHGVVVDKILQALKPVRARCVVISFDVPAIHLAREAGFAIGWVLSDYDDRARLQCDTLKPEFLFCNHEKLPPDGKKLWRGPWRWVMYEVETPQLATALAERGADFIETMAVASMIEAVEVLPSRPVG